MSSLEVRELDSAKLASLLVCACIWGPFFILSGDLCTTLCTVMSSSNLMFASYFFCFCEGSDGTPVSSIEVRKLDSRRLASLLVCQCIWGPL